MILVAADKGLCGALNTQRVPPGGAVRSGDDGLHHRRPQGGAVRRPHQAAARRRVRLWRHRRLTPRRAPLPRLPATCSCKGEVDEVRDRRHAVRQHVDPEAGDVEFLPIGEIKGLKIAGRAKPKKRSPPTRPRSCSSPAREAVLGYLLPHYLNIYIYQVLLECQGQRAKRPHGVDEERDRQRQAAHQGFDARIQQAASRQHHQGTARRSPAAQRRQ